MWIIILIFILIYYLNSLLLQCDTEDVDEVIYTFEYYKIYKSFLYLYSESVISPRRPVLGADDLTTFMYRMSSKTGSLNLLEPSRPHRACYGTPFNFTF
jgi:hypothetical protein